MHPELQSSLPIYCNLEQQHEIQGHHSKVTQHPMPVPAAPMLPTNGIDAQEKASSPRVKGATESTLCLYLSCVTNSRNHLDGPEQNRSACNGSQDYAMLSLVFFLRQLIRDRETCSFVAFAPDNRILLHLLLFQALHLKFLDRKDPTGMY